MTTVPPPPLDNAYWVLPGRLCAGEHPMLEMDEPLEQRLAHFLAAGITSFIDLTDAEEAAKLGDYVALLQTIRQPEQRLPVRRQFPIIDMTVPTAAELRTILAHLEAELAAGEVLYVHCWGGVGRTGTIIGCYLAEQGLSGDAALLRLDDLRRNTANRTVASPSTVEQCALVTQWAEQ